MLISKSLLNGWIHQFGLEAVLNALGLVVFEIADQEVLPKNGGNLNAINYRAWEKAAVEIGNLADTHFITDLPKP